MDGFSPADKITSAKLTLENLVLRQLSIKENLVELLGHSRLWLSISLGEIL
jgi:hypothetical protein